MASTKAVQLMESIYKRVDAQVRDILATLPGVTVPAQQDGSVVSAQRRIYNFQGDGVVVTDDPARNRVNVFIPGSPATGTASVFISTPGVEKTFPYGTAPANWQTNAFSDTGWANSVLESTDLTPYFVAVPTAAWVTDTTLNGSGIPFNSQFLARRTFTLPAGSILSATLEINFDDNLGETAGGIGPPDEVFINGHLMDDAGLNARSGSPLSYATLTIPIAWLNAGASNVLAANVFSQAGALAIIYRITVNMSEAGTDTQYQLLSEKDQPDGYAGLDSGGLVPTAELGTGAASATTFLRGDQTYAAASTNALTVREVDGTPSVSATAVEFPNGSLADQGGGVVRYTALSTPSFALYQEQQTSGTQGGTFTSGAWRTRLINTEVSDADGVGSLASNQVTLTAGTYEVRASAPAVFCAAHKLRLQNVTDAATLALGSSESNNASNTATRAVLVDVFTIAASKALELQHQCQTTRATDGFGTAASFGTEIYAILEFRKIG